jgi:hypothetical protein
VERERLIQEQLDGIHFTQLAPPADKEQNQDDRTA